MIWMVVSVGIILGILGFALGVTAEKKDAMKHVLRDMGVTAESVALFARAVKILRRLDGLTELDGQLSVDMLSPESKKLVSEWLADYRKSLDTK